MKPSIHLSFEGASADETPLGDSDAQGYTFGNNNTTIEAPYHVFTQGMKAFVVCNVSAIAALSGLLSNVHFPAQEDIATVHIHHLFA
jgi:hypothetical protein